MARLGAALTDALSGSADVADSRAGRPAGWEQAARIDPSELHAFLGQGLVATLSYIAEDGYPSTVPLWYVWDGTAFWLAPHADADWALQVRRDPRVSLAISESHPPLRRVLARGTVEVVEDRGGSRWRWVAADLEARYPAFGAMRRQSSEAGRQGTVLRLAPRQVTAWRGLLHHPRAVSSGTNLRSTRAG
jgi:general stress protein 26